MKAMIFSAGLGTRFKPWTDAHPKALAVVNGKSLLQRNIEYLQQYGITDVVVNVHHFADQITQALIDYKGWGSNIIISDEQDEVLETGGGLLKAKEQLRGAERFLTLNVDILTDLDLNKLITANEQSAALITLCIAERKTSRFLLFNEQNHLCGWRNTTPDKVAEKIVVPSNHLLQKAYSGIAVFQTSVLDLIPFSGKFSLIDVYLHLTKDHLVNGYDHSGDKWVDVGRPESVPVAEELFP
jgi:N-acetyl-alpha-D-muramate 1-phosphate uridylyltransferase